MTKHPCECGCEFVCLAIPSKPRCVCKSALSCTCSCWVTPATPVNVHMVFSEDTDSSDDMTQCTDFSRDINCNQYVPEQLTHLNDRNKFSFLHLNIRSLSKHHDDLVTLLTSTGCSFDVIGCSETWLNNRSYINILNLEGYKLLTKNRSGRSGSGVCLYISSRLQMHVRDDIAIIDNHSD